MTDCAEFVVRPCAADCVCARANLVAIERTDAVAKWDGEPIATIQMAPPPRSRRHAVHEASHATAAHLFGMAIREVCIEWEAYCDTIKTGASLRSNAVMMAAGPAGERWAMNRLTSTEYPADLSDLLIAIKEARIGPCDRCKIAGCAWLSVGFDAEQDAATAAYRDFEREANELVKHPVFMRAVSEMADALMEKGTLTGAEATDIANKHMRFGAMKLND
ncbi:hypothetical protein [Paracoccus sp. (in: a-proteobacteria)]|uniref:hypothetical protein n=1 Tax=Paracoccus sp. TaxID=267 RepID=UPI002AFEA961|nr:hypothetical protein [Paracoccus sp. (in: a-proteobacteria)]